ncbi:CDP-diacylglycerol--serine O-phosphatidyltransferase [bacterium]|nr:CDP-diacylglycerol--serine O-phosphatidyltransferase [bacterium]
MNHPDKLPSVYPRGIFLLPSLMTGINIMLGFYSIILVISQTSSKISPEILSRAAFMIMLAAFFDAIDGRLARWTRTTSSFGAQLDSIADVISFAIAPSILAYRWALDSFSQFGWIAALLYVLAGAIRLARFNVLEEIHSITSKKYFIGLPIPAAAISLALAVTVQPTLSNSLIVRFAVLVFIYSLAFLMISSCRFKSFKDIDWKRRRPVGTFFFLVLILLVVLHEPYYVLSSMMAIYLFTGIMMQISPKWMRRIFSRFEQWLNRVKILDDDETTTPDEPVQTITDSDTQSQ